MKSKYRWFMLFLLALLVGVGGVMMGRTQEQASYTVVEQHNAIEIRDYAPMLVAEVEVSGERNAAIRQGFRVLADYIFGHNIAAQKLPMTAPVTQQLSEKLAMTAPVIQRPLGAETWAVQFLMPSAYTLETLPQPRNPAVTLKALAPKRLLVLRFSGIPTQKRLQQAHKTLERFIAEHGLQAGAHPIYAFFDPPWTLPFFRRNEVMLELG